MDQYPIQIGLHGEGPWTFNQSAMMGGAFQLGQSEILSIVNYGCAVPGSYYRLGNRVGIRQKLIPNIDDCDFVNDLVLFCTRQSEANASLQEKY